MVLYYILTTLLNLSRYILYIYEHLVVTLKVLKKHGKSLKFLTDYIAINKTLVLKTLLFRYCISKTVIGFRL